jgi:hypothetical protein
MVSLGLVTWAQDTRVTLTQVTVCFQPLYFGGFRPLGPVTHRIAGSV